MGCGASAAPGPDDPATAQPAAQPVESPSSAKPADSKPRWVPQCLRLDTAEAAGVSLTEQKRTRRHKTSLAIQRAPVPEQLFGTGPEPSVELTATWRRLKAAAGPGGSLSLESFTKSLQEQGMASWGSEFAEALFRKFDADSNGEVSLLELAGGLNIYLKGTFREKVAATWETFDTNGNGSLEASELRAMIRCQVVAALRGVQIAAEFGDKKVTHSIEGGTMVELERGEAGGTVQVQVGGVGQTATIELEGELSRICDVSEEDLLELLQLDLILDELVQDVFRIADRDKDNSISCEEFTTFCQKRKGLTDWWGYFEV